MCRIVKPVRRRPQPRPPRPSGARRYASSAPRFRQNNHVGSVMSWIALFLGLVLASAGGAGLVASLDLLTTQLGLVYATCGAVGVSGGVIVIAIGLLIRRVDALRRTILRGNEQTRSERVEPVAPPLLAGVDPTVLTEAGVTAREAPAVEVAEPAMAPAPVF